MEKLNYDVVIVGAGISGLSAAIGAARNNVAVLIIDQLESIGGSAVHSEIGTICGILKNKTKGSRYLVNGFPKDFVSQLQSNSNSQTQYNRFGLNFIPYDSNAFLKTWNTFSKDLNIDYLLNTEVYHTEKTRDSIVHIDCRNDNREIRVQSKEFIDCSGNSIVSRCAPISTFPKSNQNSAYSFVITNVSTDNEMQVNLALMKATRNGVENKKIDERLLQTYPIQGSLQNSDLRLKITLTDQDSVQTGESLSKALVQYLASIDGVFKGIEIKQNSSLLGTRSSICSIGKSTLSKNDILSGARFDNWIAQGDWPLEVWKDGKTYLEHSQNDVFYQISLDHISSKYFDNLYFGGKIISADQEAIASARVQGVCIQTGYAAGFLAGEKTKNKPLTESLNKLQNELING